MEMTPLFKPYMPSDLPELNTILHSGALSYGKWGKQFEQKLGDYIGNPRIAVVNSYNSAMLVALGAIGIKQGDEIIASPMSCLASNQPFATQGAKVVWADIDPKTGTLSPESVKKKVTSKTVAIFHNHFCGYIGNINEICAIANEKGIIVVDDAIEAFGSEYDGIKMGNLGADMTVFSFQTVRLPNTIDGGAISFKNNKLFEKATMLRDYGINRKTFRDELGEISPLSDITMPGFGVTMNEINSYIGCLQLNKIDELLSWQHSNAQQWKNKLLGEFHNYKLLDTIPEKLPNYWVFGILAANKIDAIKYFRKKGYYASGVHLPNNYYSVFGDMNSLPGVDDFHNKFVALPCGWWFNR